MSEEKFDKKIFMGKAYLKVEDDVHFGLYRDVIVEEKNGNREKMMKPLGPLLVLRKTEGDKFDMISSHPESGEMIKLITVWDPRKD